MIIIHPTRHKPLLGVLASIFLGMTFVVAGSGKLFALAEQFELPQVLLAILIIAEIIIGLLLIACITVKFAACLSLVLIGSFLTSNILAIILNWEECLSCFGAMGTLSVAQALFIDGVMVALVVVILMWYPGRFFNKRPWYWGEKYSYNVPIVPVSHIGALEVRMVGNKTWGIWDIVAEDWIRDLNKKVEDRVSRINANKLLKLVKAKAKFNELVKG